MRFVEDARLNRLSVMLRQFDAGDRVLKGCLELFTTAEKQPGEADLAQKVNHDVTELNKTWLSRSPLGPMKKQEMRDLMKNLLSAMNQCYPDYDFSSLTPSQFSLQPDFGTVYNNVNYHLAYYVERFVPGFLQELWTAVRSVVNLSEVEVYSCRDLFTDECGLFAFDYFFHDKAHHRILFLSCVTQSKCALDPGAEAAMMVDSSDEEDEEFRNADSDSDDERDTDKRDDTEDEKRGSDGESARPEIAPSSSSGSLDGMSDVSASSPGESLRKLLHSRRNSACQPGAAEPFLAPPLAVGRPSKRVRSVTTG